MIIEMLNTSTYLVWLIAGVVLLAAELGTPGMFFFTSCSVGAFAGALSAWLGYGMMVQWAAAFVVTLITLYLLQQIVKEKHFSSVVYEKPITNVDALIGKTGMVVQEILTHKPGYVKIRGEVWSAEHQYKEALPVGTEVTIIRVDGNKVIVQQ